MTRLIKNSNRIRFLLLSLLTILIFYVLQINLVIPIFLLCLVAYLKSQPNLKKYNLLHLIMMLVLISSLAYVFNRHRVPIYYLPFCAITMLITLLFNQLELSLIVAMASSAVVAAISGNNMYVGLLFFVSGLFSTLLILGSRRRMGVIHIGLTIGILQAMLLLTTEHFKMYAPERYVTFILNGLASGIIVLGLLPIFEYLFETVTNISLLELADSHHPLLQRMVLEAPGTYHHSLIVGNLSEAACDAVGSNALLARVGAYYHDIGKLQKPDYFSENQTLRENKHDALSPTMSKLVIMNHVKEGVELARKYNINPKIIDFIQQHHGSSLVYYFYRRALEGLEDDNKVKEEGFRYPGPKPNTKETAIVLLADSVEAATRALRDPSAPKIEEVVHKIVNNKFIDGQLDECDLTLKDLEKISAVFIRILSGIYHSRITYPETNDSVKQ